MPHALHIRGILIPKHEILLSALRIQNVNSNKLIIFVKFQSYLSLSALTLMLHLVEYKFK
jgi:hypothetical protein